MSPLKAGPEPADELLMAFVGRLGSGWTREGLPASVRALALIALAGGLSAFLASFLPPEPDTPVALLRWVGVFATGASTLLWWRGDRVATWMLHALVAGGTLVVSLLVARAATGVGSVVTAADYLWMAVYAAFFLSRAGARAQLALIAVAYGAALLISSHDVPATAWVIMTASFLVAVETIGRQSELLRHEARTDGLTGLLNRKGLAAAAERAFSLADRTGIPLTVALVDLDDFKRVNDEEGHAAGDRLLVELARTWREKIEPSDILARLGGDEFLLLLVGSDEQEARRLFEQLRFRSPAPWSGGVVARRPDEDLGSCLTRADAALYATKRAKQAPPALASVATLT
jgi:diguanylate cyclase (GGDEF)-like protein